MCEKQKDTNEHKESEKKSQILYSTEKVFSWPGGARSSAQQGAALCAAGYSALCSRVLRIALHGTGRSSSDKGDEEGARASPGGRAEMGKIF